MTLMSAPGEPFPASGFDDWAETYDASITVDQFPFLGYSDLLERVFRLAETHAGQSVLDLGTGTGNLALPFAEAGCRLWCTDFSEAMLAKVRHKLPGARCLRYDLRDDLPMELKRPFDRIISSHVFHHFPLAEKVRILVSLLPHLAPRGRMVLGDIAFPDRAALEQVRTSAGEAWEDEFYWLADESLRALEEAGLNARFEPVSPCAGVFVLTARE